MMTLYRKIKKRIYDNLPEEKKARFERLISAEREFSNKE